MVVKQTLNDAPRMKRWQGAMHAFDMQEASALSEEHLDYLSCYGLLECAQMEGVRYSAGYRPYGKYRIFHQYFAQERQAGGTKPETVVIVHGYTDHAGLFAKVIRYLLSTGRSILVYDQMGHGLSSGERASTNDFNEYVDLLSEHFRFYQQALGQPLSVLAQSMGGAVTMTWLISQKSEEDKLDKLVLLAPLIRPKSWARAVWTLRLLSGLLKSVPRVYSPNSEDEAFSRFVFYEDPVQHNRLPAKWVRSMIKWVRVFEKMPANNFPLWVIQGDNDETVDWEYNIPFIQGKFPKASIRMVPQAGHHLAGESDRLQQQIFAYLEEALNA